MYIKKKYKRLYAIWHNMRDRCYNKNTKAYKDYGARGISVCYEWQESFENFFIWSMKNGYNETMHIILRDRSKPYTIDNCYFSKYIMGKKSLYT